MLNQVPRRIAFARSWQKKSNVPMAVAAVVYLVAYSLQVMYSANTELVVWLEAVLQAIWFLFLIDVVIRFIDLQNPLKFLKVNWLELLALAVPFFRILRILRVVLALRGIQGFVKDRASAAGSYIFMLVPLTWFAGAIAVLDAESSNPDASITNLREALWWSLNTITTVSSGDKYPTTFEGEFVAAVLMLTGIALFSAGAGIFASWILKEKKKAGE